METPKRTWLIVGIVAASAIVVAVALLVQQASTLPEPAQAVQNLLELRQARSTDASAYARYFESADIASTLARAASATAGSAAADKPTIPRWERPYLSAQTTSTADVVVVWVPDSRLKGWAKVTVFTVEKKSGDWKIVYAQEMSVTPPPAIGAQEPTRAP